MSAAAAWTGCEPLPLGRTVLLEASAGTGKTWQIEGLVLRLVAEYEVPIDRILVITFTRAATSELRDRIRGRLVQARDAMARAKQPEGDPIQVMLWADPGLRATRRSLLARAVSSFDLAPISTIHGFSQRMLDQLAFESGQEPGLELLVDPTPILQQVVDDELARACFTATTQEQLLLVDMGWTRGQLSKVARAMTQAVEPVVEPTLLGVDPERSSPLEPVRAWLGAKTAARAWLASPDGRACVDAVRDELNRKKGKRLQRMNRDVVGARLEAVEAWLDGPARRSRRLGGSGLGTSLRNLGLEALQKAWTGAPAAVRDFEGYPLFARVSALLAEQDRLWPLALTSFSVRVRGRLDAELVRGGRLTYSTMLSRLAERIGEQEEQHGQEGPLARAIRSRFEVALVDEFQDTDGAQWSVMRAVFAHPTRRLLIIGDPKQAIYAFRGADVHVYLDAKRAADTCSTMGRNWRSDAAYVDAMNHLWSEGSEAFGLEDIDYVQVRAAPGHEVPRIRGLPAQGDRPRCAFELRWVDGETLGTGRPLVGSKSVGEDTTARLAALEAARLLEGGAELLADAAGTGESAWRALRPGDIAVLVRTNSQAERMRSHLDRLGIPSVSAGRGSVLGSPVLSWLCAWLDAVAGPGRDAPARTLATTPLFGWTASDLATALAAADSASDAEMRDRDAATASAWERWRGSIQSWSGSWPRGGFVRVFEKALDDFGVVRRLLGARQGERHATDLRHLVELCHAQERRTGLGPSGLASWLRASAAAVGDGADEAQALRLESDARAVQLVTIHKSKGLEYPVVLLPFGWADFQLSDGAGPLQWHARVGHRTELRLNLEPPKLVGRDRAVQQAANELRQEQARLLYVALTRARHHSVAWLGPIGSAGVDTAAAALGRIALRGRDATGRPMEGASSVVFPRATRSSKPEQQQRVAAGQRAASVEVRDRLDRLADTSGGTVGWSAALGLPERERLSLERGLVGSLQARPWPRARSLISPWRVSSYTALVAGRTFDASEPQRLRQARSTAETAAPIAEKVGATVELGEPVASVTGLDGAIHTAELRGGTEVGSWAHAVLEHLDFQRCTGRDGRDLPTLVADLGARYGVRSARDHQLLSAALPEVLDTPLGGGRTGLAEGFALRALLPEDRRDELGFDLKLGDGNAWRYERGRSGGRLNQEGARVALESRVGEARWGGDSWLRNVLDRAAEQGEPVLPQIAGILTGFIDLAFRVYGAGDGARERPRYFVCDYKTNRIAPRSQRRDSRSLHYTHPWMAWEMARHGYHLQALLYTVALHRMLRQRLPGYRYDTHVGGHLYLFLRGMAGPDTPRHGGLSLGVFHDRWPASVVLGLDAAMSGLPTAAVRAIVDEARSAGGEA